MDLILVLGNQLFSPSHLEKLLGSESDLGKTKPLVFMREDRELCTYYRFHKQKIIFFLAAMRTYAKELDDAGFKVHYEELGDQGSYDESLETFIRQQRVKKVFLFEIEDKFFEKRITANLHQQGVEVVVWPSPMFVTTRIQFKNYLSKTRKPFMKTFYEAQRKRLKILVTQDLEPVGGQWSFDEDNRKALPKNVQPPLLPEIARSPIVDVVTRLCEKEFKSHPGDSGPFWLPVDRKGAQIWLDRFLNDRLEQFGPYEDAIPAHSDFLFHSVLTPFLNTGLLTPEEVVRATLKVAKAKKTPMASLEGFLRQIIGWREFVRGIYQNFSEKQDTENFWQHRMKLTDAWYEGKTGVPPFDRAIQRVQKHGYLHHIERLMVIGNLMVLLEVDPREAHRWFMEMFIDSSDWVMGPNVYGMALFSDGGIFATKPYICGSNYYRKMGGDAKGEWCDGVDGLYWGFIEKHIEFFMKNPRLSMMARSLQKMDPERLATIKEAANQLRSKLVVAPH